MADLKTMYPGVANSPETFLKENVAPEGTTLYVNDTSVFGELPTLAVIGTDQNAETVLVKSKRSDGGLDVQRAVEGIARRWEKATIIARNFTNYDYKTLVENIDKLNIGKIEKKDLKTKLSEMTSDSTHRVVTDAEKSSWDNKVDAVTGKGLSTNDYTDAAKEKVDAIPSSPKYTDTTYDVATTSANGLMSSADKTKLNGIETGAQKNSVTSVQGRTGAVTVSKSDVGLGSVNNVAITQAQVTKLNELNYTRAMTQAQYDALSTTEKNRTDVWYGIYEG